MAESLFWLFPVFCLLFKRYDVAHVGEIDCLYPWLLAPGHDVLLYEAKRSEAVG